MEKMLIKSLKGTSSGWPPPKKRTVCSRLVGLFGEPGSHTQGVVFGDLVALGVEVPCSPHLVSNGATTILRSRHPAELLHQPELVGLVPVLYDPSAFDPPNRHPGHPDLFARSRNAEEVPFVRPVRGNPSRNPVPLGNEVFDHVIARGTVDEHFERLFPSLPRRWDAWERVVFHEVGCKKLIENVGVALLAGLIDRLKEPSH